MKKFLKSLGICIRLPVINQLIIGFIATIVVVFIQERNKVSEHIYTIVFIGNFITFNVFCLL